MLLYIIVLFNSAIKRLKVKTISLLINFIDNEPLRDKGKGQVLLSKATYSGLEPSWVVRVKGGHTNHYSTA